MSGRSKQAASKPETIRRLIVGDLRRVFHHRYGALLPNDDAGHDDLELLLLVSRNGSGHRDLTYLQSRWPGPLLPALIALLPALIEWAIHARQEL